MNFETMLAYEENEKYTFFGNKFRNKKIINIQDLIES